MQNSTVFRDAVQNALDGAVEINLGELEPETRVVVERIIRLRAATERLLEAYARGEVNGGCTDWEDVDFAFEAASEALPGRYEDLYAEFLGEVDGAN